MKYTAVSSVSDLVVFATPVDPGQMCATRHIVKKSEEVRKHYYGWEKKIGNNARHQSQDSTKARPEKRQINRGSCQGYPDKFSFTSSWNKSKIG